jgi:hypothetical protein
MIREASKESDIDKVYADKAHDNRRSFNLLDDLNIEPAINIRKNASAIKIKHLHCEDGKSSLSRN